MHVDKGYALPAGQKWVGLLFVIVGGVLPVLALFNHRAIVPVCAILAVAVLAVLGPSRVFCRLRDLSIWTKFLAIGFFIWAAASVFWAPDMSASLKSLGKISGTALIGLTLVGAASFFFDTFARLALRVVLASTTIVSCLLLFDVYSDGVFSLNVLGKGIRAPYGAFWFKPVATLLAISMWPVAYFMWRTGQRLLSVLAVVLAVSVMDAIGVNTGLIATFMGFVVAVFFLGLGRIRGWFAVGVLAVTFMATPIITGSIIKPQEVTSELSLVSPAQNSIAYRLHIWHYAANVFFDKPLTGWGLNSSRQLGSDEVVSDPIRGEIGEAIPLHPHNFVLQIFLELGAIGGLIVLCLLCRVLLRLGADDWSRVDRIFAVGMFAAILFFYAASFSAWSSWWNVYICYVVALFEVARRSHIRQG